MDLNTLKNWFTTGSTPTQEQFWALLDSYRHVDSPIRAEDVNGLDQLFQQTATAEGLATHITDSNAHAGYLAKLDATNLTAINVEQWKAKLGVGTGGSVTWENLKGKPTTYTPSAHTHTIDEIATLRAELGARVIRPTTMGYYLFAGANQPAGDKLMNYPAGDILRWTTVTGFESSNFSDNNNLPRIKLVPDKNSDGTFTRMLVQDSEGYVGFKAIPTGGGASDSGWVTIPLTTPDNYETGSVVQYRKKNGRFILWGRLGLKAGVTIPSGSLCCAIPNDVILPYERLHNGMLTINVNAMLKGEAQAPKKMSLFFRPSQGYRHVIHHESLTYDIYTTEVNFYYECELN